MTYPPDSVFAVVLTLLRLEPADIYGSRKLPEVVKARMLMAGTLKDLCGSVLSYPDIARMMGRRHHSSAWEMYRRYLQMPELERVRWIEKVISCIPHDR